MKYPLESNLHDSGINQSVTSLWFCLSTPPQEDVSMIHLCFYFSLIATFLFACLLICLGVGLVLFLICLLKNSTSSTKLITNTAFHGTKCPLLLESQINSIQIFKVISFSRVWSFDTGSTGMGLEQINEHPGLIVQTTLLPPCFMKAMDHSLAQFLL